MLLDFIDFTEMTVSREPGELISELNDIFSAFDRIVKMFGCKRDKTMGDACMAVAGLPEPGPDHAADMARVALRIRLYLSIGVTLPMPALEITASASPQIR